jgi:endonuclease-3
MPRESLASRKERGATIIADFYTRYDTVCALTHRNVFELLIATILSAQCTDERVNKVTPALFRKFPTPEAFRKANILDIEDAVRSTGFFRNKAKNIQGAATKIVEEFGGEVPQTMEELLRLPGVARKTANVVLGTGFGIAVGVVVDTHVKRLTHRMGLTTQTDPVKVEKDLMKIFDEKDWIALSHLLIWHGRKVCDARKPLCGECSVADLCPKRGVDRKFIPVDGGR